MSCILRIYGESLDIDTLLSQHSLVADCTWKKGEPRIIKIHGKVYPDSGAHFLASDADLDEFDLQVTETTEFLELHAPVIARVVAFPGVQHAVRKAFVAIEYHAESYYIRLSSMVEQLHRLIGEILGVSRADREPLHQLIRRIASAAPVVGSELNCLRSRLQSAKIRRNEVAHQAEYDDERLQGLRSFLHTQAQFEMGFPTSRQNLDLLARYRDEFVADACIELSRAFADIATVFDSFLPLARAILNRNEPA
jgi:hypothetical protein